MKTIRKPFFLALLCAGIVSACAASPPAPSASIGAATQAIAAAESGGVTSAAMPEMGEARSKLLAANAAVGADQMVVADRLAGEARVDAELATARSTADKARGVNDALRRGTATLVNEIQRKSGDTP